MPFMITTLELVLLIIIPLIIFHQRGNYSFKECLRNISLLYLIWFVTYAGFHELCHLFGSWITGTTVSSYQLIPRYWKGDFTTAYVNSLFANKTQAVVSASMPYLRDILFLVIGFWALKRKSIHGHFLWGLIITLLILSPLFDIVNNYSGFVIKSIGDFNELAKALGAFPANFIGILFSATAITITLATVILNMKEPD